MSFIRYVADTQPFALLQRTVLCTAERSAGAPAVCSDVGCLTWSAACWSCTKTNCHAWRWTGALNLEDRKMKDKEISGGGKCRTGKGLLSVIFQSCIFLSCKFSRPTGRSSACPQPSSRLATSVCFPLRFRIFGTSQQRLTRCHDAAVQSIASFMRSRLLCGRLIRITPLARPSVCPSVPYGLVTRKKHSKIKIGINVPQGMSKWTEKPSFSWKGQRSPDVKTSRNCRVCGVHVYLLVAGQATFLLVQKYRQSLMIVCFLYRIR